MARGVNKVILVGNLGDDPDTKYTQGGMAVTTFRLATTESRKDKDGQRVERTEWHRVKCFGKLGEIAGEYLRKGSQCYVEGAIRYDKVGEGSEAKYFTDIVASEMRMLGGRGDGERAAPPTGGRSERPARDDQGAGPGRGPAFNDDFADDDIPF